MAEEMKLIPVPTRILTEKAEVAIGKPMGCNNLATLHHILSE